MTSITPAGLIRQLAIIEPGIEPGIEADSGTRQAHNLKGSAGALWLAARTRPFVMAVTSDDEAERVCGDIRFYIEAFGLKSEIVWLPSADTPDNVGRRAIAITRALKDGASLVASTEALRDTVRKPDKLAGAMVNLSVGSAAPREIVELELRDLGYRSVQLVTGPGQYSLRGFILDAYPTTGDKAYRIEFMGDEIESIRSIDIATQRSVEETDSFTLMPAAEPSPSDTEGVSPLSALAGRDLFASALIHADEMPEGAAAILGALDAGVEAGRAGTLEIAGLGLSQGERRDVFALPQAASHASADCVVMIVASSDGQAERLRDVFRDQDVVCPIVARPDAGRYSGQLFITAGALSEGLRLPGLIILTEREVFGGRPAYRAIKASKVKGLLTSIDDLSSGDYVVHEDRGIGRFIGLMHQEVEGIGYDMLVIEYEGGSRLNLPLDAIDRIKKYHAAEGVEPKLDSLGGRQWQKTRDKVRARIREMAAELLAQYAEREVSEGHAFSADGEAHREFDRFFPYDETPDQVRAIEEIKDDMERVKPMDRLLSGDVGYGKTEVAMRAAFKAVFDGKQVAVLVPTTLLCEQHYRVFRKRFEAFPVSVEAVNRFKSKKESAGIYERLRKGALDIVIGTHALLRKDLAFRDLGLVIIDEEHRFGVAQKEKVRSLCASVDVLAMSATPIPRTLQMSLSGIRGMSVIETPPEERIAVRSAVAAYNDGLVKDAVTREVERGGQVFFIHNRVRDIDKWGARVRKLVPLARVAVAHGQLSETELERVMLGYLNREFDVLVSTAIVGAGLDIPTANTIIVNRADMMGLADLYQLKGRVGRSNIKAYAWFLVPGEDLLTEEARQRLEALEEMSFMGAGFRLAMRDLEIRGAGNLLGAEQSGAIEAVGLDLYMEMLESSVAELRGRPRKTRLRPVINMPLSAYIPEDYVNDMALRLSIYRSISTAGSAHDLDETEAELADRFGPVPEAVSNLIKVKTLSLMAEAVGVSDVSVLGTSARFRFAPDAGMTAERVMAALPHKLRFHPDGFEVNVKQGDTVAAVSRVIDALAGVTARRD